VQRVIPNLEMAAAEGATFYAMLASEQLGREAKIVRTGIALDGDKVRAFAARWPGAGRAAALAQIGRQAEAEIEMRALHARLPAFEDPMFIALADAIATPGAALHGSDVAGQALATGQCPRSPYGPQDGFRLDPALLAGLIRQESRFDTDAVSRSNAQGLMQVLPSTAAWMEDDPSYRRNPRTLHDPGLNMKLGQKYLEYILLQVEPDGDLSMAFAAYNGGPGFVQRWRETFDGGGDPLVILESIPKRESRVYAERVMAYAFVCRFREGKPNPELEALAAGLPPVYRGPLPDRVPVGPQQ
jgi:soluble lytic murein transglycosylase